MNELHRGSAWKIQKSLTKFSQVFDEYLARDLTILSVPGPGCKSDEDSIVLNVQAKSGSSYLIRSPNRIGRVIIPQTTTFA